jgi:CBS domain-containing protein
LTHLDRPAPHDRYERRLMDDSVSTLEPVPTLTARPNDSIRSAIRTLVDHNVGAVVVVDTDGVPVGMLSERDLLMRGVGLQPDFLDLPVSDLMTRNPECVDESANIAFALHKMDGGDYRHLPVTRDGKLIGMISVRDMLRYVADLCRENGG